MPKVSLLLLVVVAGLTQIANARAVTSESNTEQLTTENSVPRFTYERHLLGFKIEYLHRVNIGDIDGLRAELQDWMVWDAFAVWQLVQEGRLTPQEREEAYDQLRLMAVQAEKYPVAKWTENAELQDIFRAAIADNPEHAASLRAKNWNRPMWLP